MGNQEVFQIWQILTLALLEIYRFIVHSTSKCNILLKFDSRHPFHRNYGSTNVRNQIGI